MVKARTTAQCLCVYFYVVWGLGHRVQRNVPDKIPVLKDKAEDEL